MLEAGNPHGLKVSRAIDQPGIHVVFSPEREDPGNDTIARHDIPKVIGGCGPAAFELGSRALRNHLSPRSPGQQPCGGRDDQAA